MIEVLQIKKNGIIIINYIILFIITIINYRGASILIPSNQNTTIIGIDTNNLIHEIYNVWKISENYNRTASKMFVKMDIEGSGK